MSQTPSLDPQLDPVPAPIDDAGKPNSGLIAICALVALVVILSIRPADSNPDAELKASVIGLFAAVMVLVVAAISMFGGQPRFWVVVRAFIICGFFAAPVVFTGGSSLLDGDGQGAIALSFGLALWVFGIGYLIRSFATKAVGFALLGVLGLFGGVARLIDGHPTGALGLTMGGALVAIGATAFLNIDVALKVAVVNRAFIVLAVPIVILGAVALVDGRFIVGVIALGWGAWALNAARKNKLVVVRQSEG